MTDYDGGSQYARALLDHVQTGAYPESEDVISADLPSTTLPNILQLVREARTDLENDVRKRSRSVAPDVDGWITSTKKLRDDIQSSQEEALEISRQGVEANEIQSRVHDATKKIELLEEEHAFNHELQASLTQLQRIRERLDSIQNDILSDELSKAGDDVSEIEQTVKIRSQSSSNVRAALASKATQLKADATERLLGHWNNLVKVNQHDSCITINSARDESHISLDSVVGAMAKLGILDGRVLNMSRNIEQLILHPRLHIRPDQTVQSLQFDRDSIASLGRSKDLKAKALFSDLQSMIEFLEAKLPPLVSRILSTRLGPPMISQIISLWLLLAVPTELDELEDFQDTVHLVEDFAQHVEKLQWPGKRELDGWVESIPQTWVRRRHQTVLDRTRKLLSVGITSTAIVERTETQTVSKTDEVFANKDNADDWNASWSDDEKEESAETAPSTSSQYHEGKLQDHDDNDDDEDGGAWGLDEKESTADAAHEKLVEDDEDAGDAWGWGEDDEQSSPVAPKSGVKSSELISNGVKKNPSDDQQQQVTLRETYTITSLPPEILGIIERIFEDCDALGNPPFDKSQFSQCGSILKDVPLTTLAFFRAISPDVYASHLSGSMLLYNDCQWLAEQLRNADRFKGSNFPAQAASLEVHGKRAYSKEMDSQRTIMTDLLDGAQGFVNCTQHPFNQECDIAVASAIDRIRQLQRQWKDILSHSALLQAIGSLISTICSKFILDIEDMSDISEPESQQLTKYCSRVGTLEDIFTPDMPGGSSAGDSEVVPLTAAYVPSWLKFQYLANILESSLADIKYLWIEGGLSLEFEVEEVVDLIVALFAEGPHRRSAITEIKAARPER